MPLTTAAEQVQRAKEMEAELKSARRAVSRALRQAREAKGIGLKAAARKLRIDPSSLSRLERGSCWSPRLAARVVRFLERVA